jgi:hypothetical protein
MGKHPVKEGGIEDIVMDQLPVSLFPKCNKLQLRAIAMRLTRISKIELY